MTSISLARIISEATGKTHLVINTASDNERLGLKRELYNSYSGAYERRTEEALTVLEPDLRLFARQVVTPHVVDLGSGPGRDAGYLRSIGLHPLCIDFAVEPLKRCTRKGLETRCINYETQLDDSFLDNSLGGLWTNCSLTTTPRTKIREILAVIYRKLIPGAPAFFGFIEDKGGYNEGWINPGDKYKIARFRFRDTREGIARLLREADFHIIYFRVVPREISGKNTYLNYFCVKPFRRQNACRL